jgi:hypothetical protein
VGQLLIEGQKYVHALYQSYYQIKFIELFSLKFIAPCQVTRVYVSEAEKK